MAKNAMPVSKAKTAYGLLSEVARVILAEPRRYDQGQLIERITPTEADDPPCGTVACVAGWTALLKMKRPTDRGAWDNAQRILGLSNLQSSELFGENAVAWSSDQATYAKRGAEHIAAFQKKYAKQLKAKRV